MKKSILILLSFFTVTAFAGGGDTGSMSTDSKEVKLTAEQVCGLKSPFTAAEFAQLGHLQNMKYKLDYSHISNRLEQLSCTIVLKTLKTYGKWNSTRVYSIDPIRPEYLDIFLHPETKARLIDVMIDAGLDGSRLDKALDDNGPTVTLVREKRAKGKNSVFEKDRFEFDHLDLFIPIYTLLSDYY